MIDAKRITIQRPKTSFEKFSRNRISKAFSHKNHKSNDENPLFYDHSCILKLSSRRPHVPAPHGSTRKELGTSSEPVKLEDSIAPFRPIKRFRAMVRGKFSNNHSTSYSAFSKEQSHRQLVLSRTHWYGCDSGTDTGKPKNGIPHSHILAF